MPKYILYYQMNPNCRSYMAYVPFDLLSKKELNELQKIKNAEVNGKIIIPCTADNFNTGITNLINDKWSIIAANKPRAYCNLYGINDGDYDSYEDFLEELENKLPQWHKDSLIQPTCDNYTEAKNRKSMNGIDIDIAFSICIFLRPLKN